MNVLTNLRYGSVVAVPELILDPDGRAVIFGPNGAGKTTLLRILAGRLPGPALDAAYLPQRPYLFRGSAGHNLGLGLSSEQTAHARQLVERFGLPWDVLRRGSGTLSGGERQRLVLARTIARPEPWVLLDEPLAAIDVRDRMDIARELVAALDRRGVVIVTHDRDVAAAMGDSVAVMIDGTIQQVGPVAEVFALPVTERVASVIGTANVLEGRTSGLIDPLVALDLGGVEVWGIGSLPSGSSARALFGAEAVTIYEGAATTGSAQNHWRGTVVDVRQVDRLLEIIVDVGVRVVAVITPGAQASLELRPGVEVTVAVKATAVRIVPT
ncbi:MAG: ATP-binding cassette domain-containing protein [Gammaproteobacteria bacterium]|nr:ATP-binding cassette domain-containing protein [Gammaproteobacteria bacterium]